MTFEEWQASIPDDAWEDVTVDQAWQAGRASMKAEVLGIKGCGCEACDYCNERARVEEIEP